VAKQRTSKLTIGGGLGTLLFGSIHQSVNPGRGFAACLKKSSYWSKFKLEIVTGRSPWARRGAQEVSR